MAKSIKKEKTKPRLKLITIPKDQWKHRNAEMETLKAELKTEKALRKKTIKKDNRVGSARGIESLFRSSYRAQLDMIALAATKANIMISLNGLLVSMLLLSGAYFLSADRLLLLPVASLLVTCTIAIIFAVLAARPDVDNRKQTFEDFESGNADMLIFEQFSKLSPSEFDQAMWAMLKDQDSIYHNMIAHIYDLGCIADRKFARLYISYNSFMVGLIISVLCLLTIVAYTIFVKA